MSTKGLSSDDGKAFACTCCIKHKEIGYEHSNQFFSIHYNMVCEGLTSSLALPIAMYHANVWSSASCLSSRLKFAMTFAVVIKVYRNSKKMSDLNCHGNLLISRYQTSISDDILYTYTCFYIRDTYNVTDAGILSHL